MSRNTVGVDAPGCRTRMRPPCSTTKSRLLPSRALVRYRGLLRLPSTSVRRVGVAVAAAGAASVVADEPRPIGDGPSAPANAAPPDDVAWRDDIDRSEERRGG